MSEFDKVELITEKLHVSFEEAGRALRKCGGDLLDAMRYLERVLDDRKYGTPETSEEDPAKNNGSVKPEQADEMNRILAAERARIREEERARARAEEREAYMAARRELGYTDTTPKSEGPSFGQWLGSLVKKSMENYLVVSHEGVVKFRISVFALAILFLFFHATLLVAMGVALFFGVTYRFVGKDDLSRVNDAMGRVGNTATEWWGSRNYDAEVNDLCRKYDRDDLK